MFVTHQQCWKGGGAQAPYLRNINGYPLSPSPYLWRKNEEEEVGERTEKGRWAPSSYVSWICSLFSMRYAFSTLKSATNNFAEQNKIGESTFGPVYIVSKS